MNIAQIAKLAGVAPATVSRYLNNGYVSAEKREKIRRIIAETGYSPRCPVPIVRVNKSYLIAIIVPKLVSESTSAMLEGISAALAGTGYNLILANTFGSVEKEIEYLRLYRDDDVDGVILIGTVITNEHHNVMRGYSKPIVLLNQFDKNYPCVYFDDYSAAYTSVKHLIAKGCRRIAGIYVPPVNKGEGRSRIDGCYDAMMNSALSYDEKLMAESDHSAEGGQAAMKQILSSGMKFDGLFCATDTIAVGALRVMEAYGLKTPDDVKVATIGNSSIMAVPNTSLTSAQLNYNAGGREAFNILMERIEGNTKIMKQYKLGFELIERESTHNI
jgi:LacI family sucrose operon transcriptional repressor